MAGPCLDPSPQIDLTLTGSPGALRATPILSPDANNGVENRSNGIWAPAHPPLIVGSLPASPTDGDEILYMAESTRRILWHLRYDASEATSSKWKFIGGGPLFAKVKEQGTLAGPDTTWTEALSGTPAPALVRITLGLTGYYLVEFGGQVGAGSDGSAAQIGASIIGQVPSNDDVASNYNTRVAAVTGNLSPWDTQFASGVIMRLVQRPGAGTGTAVYTERWLKITPYAVG